MNQSINLSVKTRNANGSRAMRTLRQQGVTPGVVYGHNFASTSIEAPTVEVERAYSHAGKHHPIELEIDGKQKLAMIKQVAVNPVKRNVLHIAFHVVKQNEKVEAQVPVVIAGKGSTPAERAGLVLLQPIEMVTVQALPREIPDELTIDGEKLAAEGDHLTIADIKLPKGITVVGDTDKIVVNAYEPSALVAANEAADQENAEQTEEAAAEAENSEEPQAVNEAA